MGVGWCRTGVYKRGLSCESRLPNCTQIGSFRLIVEALSGLPIGLSIVSGLRKTPTCSSVGQSSRTSRRPVGALVFPWVVGTLQGHATRPVDLALSLEPACGAVKGPRGGAVFGLQSRR